MKFPSRKMATLTIVVWVGLVAGGLGACQSRGPANKTNFTKAEFEKLRWLEGSWRGSDPGGQNPFFERYRFVGEGRIEVDHLTDATLSNVDHQGAIYLENGEIIDKGGTMSWTASRLDDTQIEFVPKEKATEPFTWKKESSDVWVARLAGKDPQGRATETVYRMERIKQ
jgi:hypothetical protein